MAAVHHGLALVFNRATIIEKVKENRAQHIEDYADAFRGYLLEVEEQAVDISKESSKLASKAAKNKDLPEYFASWRITAEKPEDHEKDYDRALSMLELAVDEEIRLDEKTFAQYVRDEWDWKEQFHNLSSGYFSKFNLRDE